MDFNRELSDELFIQTLNSLDDLNQVERKCNMPTKKQWVEDNGGHTLYFTPYYDLECVARIWERKPNEWTCMLAGDGPPTRRDAIIFLQANDVIAAKEETENLVREEFSDWIKFYKSFLEAFDEESV